MQRLLPPHLVGLLLIAMATTALLFDGPTIFGSSLRWIGALPGAAGLALNLSGARLFERTGTNIRTFDEPEIFVESGAFRWTRNPMYLGFLVVLLGMAAMIFAGLNERRREMAILRAVGAGPGTILALLLAEAALLATAGAALGVVLLLAGLSQRQRPALALLAQHAQRRRC